MNNQEAFDTALRGMRAQGYALSKNEGDCCYFADNGNRCAVGHLLPESTKAEVTLKFNMVHVHLLQKLLPEVGKALKDCGFTFLKDLQAIHDVTPEYEEYDLKGYFESQMRRLAVNYNLNFTEPAE